MPVNRRNLNNNARIHPDDARVLFLALGPDRRTIRNLTDAIVARGLRPPSPPTLANWRDRDRWLEGTAEFDAKVQIAAEAELVRAKALTASDIMARMRAFQMHAMRRAEALLPLAADANDCVSMALRVGEHLKLATGGVTARTESRVVNSSAGDVDLIGEWARSRREEPNGADAGNGKDHAVKH